MDTVRTTLVVDGCPERRHALRALLERDGECVVSAADVGSALARLGDERPTIVLAAAGLADLQRLARALRDRDPLVQLVLLGPPPEGESPRTMLRRLQAVGWHEPADGERLLTTVEAAAQAHAHGLQLQVADRHKTDLLASVSHELRTPLAVIIGYLDLVREGTVGDCPAEACRLLDRARGNARWLLDLVEEFLDLSQLEVGAARVRREPIDPGPLLRELAEAFAVLVRGKPVRFLADVPAVLPAVAADRAKVRVIVQNLLANAAKFTTSGQIRLAATADATGGVCIAVEDTGPGIAREHHEAVFDPFRQLEPAAGSRHGVGLGLALGRRFARMMGGELSLTSTVGVGSTFTLTLPPACGPEARSEAA